MLDGIARQGQRDELQSGRQRGRHLYFHIAFFTRVIVLFCVMNLE